MGRGIKKIIHQCVGAVGAIFASAGLAFGFECVDTKVDIRGDWGSARFTVEIADDNAERAQGLMNREKMATSAGMLFIFPQPHRASFWMRNTLIPLDLLFVDATGVVTRVHENAIPLDESAINGGEGVLAVLEINGGLSLALGISAGSQLRHPSFAQESAIWPCKGE